MCNVNRGDPKIILRNIKATNILLDYNFESKVADFGFINFGVTDESHFYHARQIRFFDYVAPESVRTGILTYKSDVYSYGVMLLELITGRKPIVDSDPNMDQGLVNWIERYLEGEISLDDLYVG